MSKMVAPYRLEIAHEMRQWNGFAKGLGRKNKKEFKGLIDVCKTYSSKNYTTDQPVRFEPKVMSELVSLQNQLRKLELQMNDLVPA